MEAEGKTEHDSRQRWEKKVKHHNANTQQAFGSNLLENQCWAVWLWTFIQIFVSAPAFPAYQGERPFQQTFFCWLWGNVGYIDLSVFACVGLYTCMACPGKKLLSELSFFPQEDHSIFPEENLKKTPLTTKQPWNPPFLVPYVLDNFFLA